MRIVIKIWDGKEDSDVAVDINMELDNNNSAFIHNIIDSYVPQPTTKATSGYWDTEEYKAVPYTTTVSNTKERVTHIVDVGFKDTLVAVCDETIDTETGKDDCYIVVEGADTTGITCPECLAIPYSSD